MAKIKAALAQLAEKLVSNRALLARAQRRYKANRKRAFIAHNQAIAKEKNADRLRAAGGYPATGAQFVDQEAARLHHKAFKNHGRAQFWLGRIKALTQRIHGLETTQAGLEAERKKLVHVTISGDKATGGSVHERMKAVGLKSAAECAAGHRENFYEQGGRYNVSCCITGPPRGCRDDCSSWKTSVHHSCGLKDPNGERYAAGYTETLRNYAVANGLVVSRSELKPGGSVIYGTPGATHHVEMFVGPGEKTIGHGSSPVDAGIVNLFGSTEYMTFVNYHD